MDTKQRLIKHISKYRKIKFCYTLAKITVIGILIILSPLLSLDYFHSKDIIKGVLFFILSEIILVGIFLFLLNQLSQLYSIKNSRVYLSINDIDSVSKIMIYKDKIFFDICGMEDETIYIGDSKSREKLITDIVNVFGESKITYFN